MTRPLLPSTRRAMRGFSLIEMMTAITIGLIILVGLTSVFVNTSNTSRELKNTAEQIESGRYAIEFLTQDIRHAGFYGELSSLPTAPATAPDPCTAPTEGVVAANDPMSLPVQFVSPTSIPTNCAALLTSANLQPNSDIVVVRRVETTALPVTCTTAATVSGTTVYLQTTADAAEIQIPTTTQSIISTKNATGVSTTATMMRRDFTVTAGQTAGTCAAAVTGQYPLVAAAIRKYLTNIYFVAPCSVPASGSLCTSAADQGRPIPTLKRLEMGANGTFSIVSVAEGIEAIRVEYGIDDSPSAADPGTGLIGDGVPDRYTNTPTVSDMSNTIAVRVYVLARNTAPSSGYTDDKTYTMGTYTTAAANDRYKRHVYGAETRIVNQGGRREIPH